MKIRYVHCSEPDKEKIHDTEVVLKKNRFIEKTQEEFDEFTLCKMQKDLEDGILLSYSVIEEAQ